MQTTYIPVEASNVNVLSAGIPSDADTTSGYYLSYEATIDGGFSGHGWYLDITGNPFVAAGITTPEAIVQHYNDNNGNFNDIFGNWKTNAGDIAVSNFCNTLINKPGLYPNCITMTTP